MKWQRDYTVTQDPSTHNYRVLDKNGKLLLEVPGITSRINEYFGSYQNDFPKEGLSYLDSIPLDEIKKRLLKQPSPIPGSRIKAGVGAALRFRTGMSEQQLNSYVLQRTAIEQGTVVHEELQNALRWGIKPSHPKAQQLWDRFVRKYPPSRYSYESEVPVTDMKKWGTSIDVVVTDRVTGAVSILDWKTGREHAPEHRAQLTKEAQMYELMTGKKVQSLGVVYPGKIQNHSFMASSEISKIFRKNSTFKQLSTRSAAASRPYTIQTAQQYLQQLHIKKLPAGADLRDYSDEVTFFDTETGHGNQILQVGAIKGRINLRTGAFEYVDVYERYYDPQHTHTKAFRDAQAVHHIDQAVQDKYRALTKANYSRIYNEEEQQALMDFIGPSVVAGHAILQSDLPWTGLHKIPNNIYDTFEASRYVYKNESSYGLEQLYNRYIGRRTELHQAFIDALMNAQFGARMALRSNKLRWLLTHPGYATYPQDIALEGTDMDPLLGRSGISSTAMGARIQDYIKGLNMIDTYDADLDDQIANNEDLRGMGLDIHSSPVSREAFLNFGDQWSDLYSALSETVTHLDSYAKTVQGLSQSLNDGIAGYNLTTNRRLMSQIMRKYNENDWDAALEEELKVPKVDIAKYHSRLLRMRDREDRANWAEAEQHLSNSVQYGLISQSQADTIKKAAQSVDDLNNGLQRQIENNKHLQATLANMKWFDMNQLHQAVSHEWSGIKGVAQGVIPSWFSAPVGRFGNAFMNAANRNMATYNATKNIWQSVGQPALSAVSAGAGGKIGAALGSAGGPVGAVLGWSVGNAIGAGVSQVWGNIQTAKTIHRGERIQEVLNISGGIIDMIVMPLKLLGNLLKNLIRLFGMLAGAVAVGIKSMQNLATPLTHLTGVHFPLQQGLEAAGHLTGLGKDAYGNAYNDFANQAQALYATGQMNRDRLVAASMLGVFSHVYSPTADADDMYGNTVDSILAQMRGADPTRRKQLMTLAGRVDSTLPQTLQVMSDLNMSSWKNMRTYAGYAYFRPHTDSERTLYRRQSFQFQGNLESMMNSIRRIASRLWEVGGKQIMDFLNRTLDSVATIVSRFSSINDAWNYLKSKIGEGWAALKKSIGWDDIGANIVAAIKKWLPSIIYAVEQVAHTIVSLWFKAVDLILDKGGLLLSYLNTLKIVKDKNSALGFRLQVGADDFSEAGKKHARTEALRHVTFYTSGGQKYIPKGLTPMQYIHQGQLYEVPQGAPNDFAHAMQTMAPGAHAEVEIAGRTIAVANTHASAEDWTKFLKQLEAYKRGNLSESTFLAELAYDFPHLLYGESYNTIASLYSQRNPMGHLRESIARNEEPIHNVIRAVATSAADALTNTVDINISVNNKPGWKIAAGAEGVTVVADSQRIDVGDMYIKATTNTLEQKGRQRGGGGN